MHCRKSSTENCCCMEALSVEVCITGKRVAFQQCRSTIPKTAAAELGQDLRPVTRKSNDISNLYLAKSQHHEPVQPQRDAGTAGQSMLHCLCEKRGTR